MKDMKKLTTLPHYQTVGISTDIFSP